MWAKCGKKVGKVVGETMFFELFRLCEIVCGIDSDCVHLRVPE